MKLRYQVLLILLLQILLTIQQNTQTREQLQIASNAYGDPFTYWVSDDELPHVREYGFSMWVKFSYLYPNTMRFNQWMNQNLGIAGIHENGPGYCSEDIGHRGLALFFSRLRMEDPEHANYLLSSYETHIRPETDPPQPQEEQSSRPFRPVQHTDSDEECDGQDTQSVSIRRPSDDDGECDDQDTQSVSIRRPSDSDGEDCDGQDTQSVSIRRHIDSDCEDCEGFDTQSVSIRQPGNEDQSDQQVQSSVNDCSEDEDCSDVDDNVNSVSVNRGDRRDRRNNRRRMFLQTSQQPSNREELIAFPNTQVDMDHSWNFIYVAYSYEQHKVVAYMYFSGSDETRYLEWDQLYKRDPIRAVRFRLGGCNPDDRKTYQAWYNNARFFYGSFGQGGFINQRNQIEQIRMETTAALNIPMERNQVIQDVLDGTILVTTRENEMRRYTFTELDGPKEYSVYGWAQFLDNNRHNREHILFRLTSKSEGDYRNNRDVGDRTLACFLNENGLVFSTYTMDWSSQSKNINIEKEMPNDQIGNWFFIYFGYSYTEQKAFAFVKFQDQEMSLEWDNVNHMLPDQLLLLIANDQYNRAFNGKLKKWKIAYDTGAFKTTNFEELYQETIDDSESVPELNEEADPTDINNGYQSDDSAYNFVVPEQDLLEVQDITFTFWFQWTYYMPQYADIENLREHFTSIAHVSESDRGTKNMGDRVLSMWLMPFSLGRPAYVFSTYNKASDNPNENQQIVVDNGVDFDYTWNWVYYSYSYEEKEAFVYLYFSKTNRVETLRWQNVKHTYPPESLHFRLGKTLDNQFSFNGRYFNPQFYYTGKTYLRNRNHVTQFFEDRLTKPNLDKDRSFTQRPIIVEEIEKNIDSQDESKLETVDGAGSYEYAVYGWAKWLPSVQLQQRHTLYRLYSIAPEHLADKEKAGDRTLMVSVGEGNIYFSTYSHQYQQSENELYFEHGIPYEDDLETWFWVYFGYSYTLKKAYGYIKFYDREVNFLAENVQHQVPEQLTVDVGTDRFYPNFNGRLKDFYLAWGLGAYREQGYSDLQNIPDDENEPNIEVDNFWTEEPELIIAPDEEEGPYEIIVPEEDLQFIDSYSFSFWTKFSFSDPSSVTLDQVRNRWQAIAGITEKVGYHDGSQPGGRALSLYMRPLGGNNGQPTYYFSTYATNRQNNDDYKDMPFSADELDSQWNWIYFGYSISAQKAYAFVYFSATQQRRILEWDQTVHKYPDFLKFQLGKPLTDPAMKYNGQFYDVRFRWDLLAYKISQLKIQSYFANSIYAPPTQKPEYTEVKLTESVKRVDQNNLIKLIEFPSRFRGATQYSVYGWAKWTQTEVRQDQHLLFRVTTNTQDTTGNMDKAGDRTLVCFVTRNTLKFSTYSFGLQGQSEWNIVQEVPFEDELTSWFFIYFGYDAQTKIAKGFIKFQDRIAEISYENIRHQIPKYFGIYLYKDNFYPGFNGQLKKWYFTAGQGSFKQQNYEELYDKVYPEEQSDEQLYESQTQQEGDSDSTVFSAEIPAPLINGLRSVTSWTWLQWGFNRPRHFGNPSEANENCYHIARLIYAPDKGVFVDQCFSQDGQASIQFTETSYSNPQVQTFNHPDISDVDSSWNYVYMAHDYSTRRTVVYVFFKASEQNYMHIFENAVWQQPPDFVRFRVGGGRSLGKQVFNGYFFDSQLTSFQYFFKDNEGEIQTIKAEQSGNLPTFRDPALDTQEEVNPFTLNEDGTVETNENTIESIKNIRNYQKLKSYAVFGWMKWVGPRIQVTRNTIAYRLAQNEPEYITDKDKPGDRSLALWLLPDNSFEISTYKYGVGESQNVPDVKYRFDENFSNRITQWFFLYHGYSYEQKRTYFVMKFYDGTKVQKSIDNLQHLQSNYYGLYLGKDWIHIPWNGKYYGFSFYVGFRAFIDHPDQATGLIELAQPPIVPDNNGNEEESVDPNVDGEVEDQNQGLDGGYNENLNPIVTQETEQSEIPEGQSGWFTYSVPGIITDRKFENRGQKTATFFHRSYKNGEYKITLGKSIYSRKYSSNGKGQICFGYVPRSLLEQFENHPQRDFHSLGTGYCSNDITYNYFGGSTCTGSLNLQEDATFLIKTRANKVIIKQMCGDLRCVFDKQRGEKLIPWIEITRNHKVYLNKDQFGDLDIIDQCSADNENFIPIQETEESESSIPEEICEQCQQSESTHPTHSQPSESSYTPPVPIPPSEYPTQPSQQSQSESLPTIPSQISQPSYVSPTSIESSRTRSSQPSYPSEPTIYSIPSQPTTEETRESVPSEPSNPSSMDTVSPPPPPPQPQSEFTIPTEQTYTMPSEPTIPSESRITRVSQPSYPTDETRQSVPSEPSYPSTIDTQIPSQPSVYIPSEQTMPVDPSIPTSMDTISPLTSQYTVPSQPSYTTEETRESVPSEASYPSSMDTVSPPPPPPQPPSEFTIPTEQTYTMPSEPTIPSESRRTRGSQPSYPTDETRQSVPSEPSYPSSIDTQIPSQSSVYIPSEQTMPVDPSIPTSMNTLSPPTSQYTIPSQPSQISSPSSNPNDRIPITQPSFSQDTISRMTESESQPSVPSYVSQPTYPTQQSIPTRLSTESYPSGVSQPSYPSQSQISQPSMPTEDTFSMPSQPTYSQPSQPSQPSSPSMPSYPTERTPSSFPTAPTVPTQSTQSLPSQPSYLNSQPGVSSSESQPSEVSQPSVPSEVSQISVPPQPSIRTPTIPTQFSQPTSPSMPSYTQRTPSSFPTAPTVSTLSTQSLPSQPSYLDSQPGSTSSVSQPTEVSLPTQQTPAPPSPPSIPTPQPVPPIITPSVPSPQSMPSLPSNRPTDEQCMRYQNRNFVIDAWTQDNNQVINGLILQNLEGGVKHFNSRQNPNGNYKITLNEGYRGGKICFGYIKQAQLQELRQNPNQSFSPRTISVCTDDIQQNYYGEFACRGRFVRSVGQQFRLSVKENEVRIKSTKTNFRCIFSVPQNVQLIPFVEMDQDYSVTTQFTGLGGLNCETRSLPSEPSSQETPVLPSTFTPVSRPTVITPVPPTPSIYTPVSPPTPTLPTPPSDSPFTPVYPPTVQPTPLPSIESPITPIEPPSQDSPYPPTFTPITITPSTESPISPVSPPPPPPPITYTPSYTSPDTPSVISSISSETQYSQPSQGSYTPSLSQPSTQSPYTPASRPSSETVYPTVPSSESPFTPISRPSSVTPQPPYPSEQSSESPFTPIQPPSQDTPQPPYPSQPSTESPFTPISAPSSDTPQPSYPSTESPFTPVSRPSYDTPYPPQPSTESPFTPISPPSSETVYPTVPSSESPFTPVSRPSSVTPYPPQPSTPSQETASSPSTMTPLPPPISTPVPVCENFLNQNAVQQFWQTNSANAYYNEKIIQTNGENGQFTSPQNILGNYRIQFQEDYTNGWICFGYIPTLISQQIEYRPNDSYYQYSLGVCTDNTQYNFGGDYECQGVMNTNAGSVLDVLVLSNLIKIKQRGFECIFQNRYRELIPWVEVQGQYSLGVDFLGIGGENCEEPETPSPTTPVLPSEPTQQSPITVESYPTQPSSRSQPSRGSEPSSRSQPSRGSEPSSQSQPSRGQPTQSGPSSRSQPSPSRGTPSGSEPSSRSQPSRGSPSQSSPSIESQPSRGSPSRSEPSYRSEPSQISEPSEQSQPEDCSQFDNPDAVTQRWVSTSAEGFISNSYMRNNGQQTVTFMSPANENGNYRLSLLDDYRPGQGQVCFGFVTTQVYQQIRQNPNGQYHEQAVALCNDARTFDPNQRKQCSGKLNEEAGAGFRVQVNRRTIEIMALNSNYRCFFEKDPDAVYIPWVEIEQSYSVNGNIRGIGGADCREKPSDEPEGSSTSEPSEDQCARLFSECGFQGNECAICGEQQIEVPDYCEGEYLSIYVPKGQVLSLGCTHDNGSCPSQSLLQLESSTSCLPKAQNLKKKEQVLNLFAKSVNKSPIEKNEQGHKHILHEKNIFQNLDQQEEEVIMLEKPKKRRGLRSHRQRL